VQKPGNCRYFPVYAYSGHLGNRYTRLITACKQYGLQEPTFEEFGDGIKVTIYRTQADKQISRKADKQADKQINKRTSEHINAIERYLDSVEDASAKDIADAIGLSPARTRAILSEMSNRIEVIGITNGRRYRKRQIP